MIPATAWNVVSLRPYSVDHSHRKCSYSMKALADVGLKDYGLWGLEIFPLARYISRNYLPREQLMIISTLSSRRTRSRGAILSESTLQKIVPHLLPLPLFSTGDVSKALFLLLAWRRLGLNIRLTIHHCGRLSMLLEPFRSSLLPKTTFSGIPWINGRY